MHSGNKKAYSNLNDIRNFNFSRPSRYFKDARRFFLPFQQGVASSENFFENTIVLFTETAKPDRDPDYASPSGSVYWYSDEGVIRGADHWGNGVDTCDWALKLTDGRTVYGVNSWDVKCLKDYRYGFARWSDFVLKTRTVEIDNQPVDITFTNSKGHDTIVVNGKKYHRVVVESWEPEEA